MLSGDGFSDMMFDVHVVSPLAFPGWAADTARGDQVLNSDSYAKLARQSVEVSNTSYRLADPELPRLLHESHSPRRASRSP